MLLLSFCVFVFVCQLRTFTPKRRQRSQRLTIDVVAGIVAAAAAAAVGAPGKQFFEHPRDTLISQVAQVSQVVVLPLPPD